MAEEEGFEPPEPAKAQRFSRPPHSTTLPLLRRAVFGIMTGGLQEPMCGARQV
jgi:hypothetical protein